ncbi:hypothetical protein GCM10022225_09100 [Plantactinospora mayteni]|uniref:Secreted protein n=1 Tax=Plantactinospora mayteni TaxID=566021 RepID=A0ABQ4EHX2_9ACTN|nr:hypothetical protein [Plantactinospora mayteni]GIG94343.1 hypothetical protein Pma05_09160 [Plantactinospora mayteni]
MGLLLPAVLLAVAGLSAPPPGAAAVPARRGAALGTLTITPTGGTVGGNPMLVSATTSAPCPARYGSAALLRVGPVGGPYSNIARPGGAGGYDTAPVTMNPNRSMVMSQGRPPGDGEYVIVVECVSDTLGTHPDRFESRIVVSGDSWRVRSGGAGQAAPTATGSGQTTGAPSDPDRDGTPTAPAASSGTAGEPTVAATAPPELASRGDEGGSPLPWVLGGVVALLACVAAVPLIRRRGSRQP